MRHLPLAASPHPPPGRGARTRAHRLRTRAEHEAAWGQGGATALPLTAAMTSVRTEHTATLLANGRLLVVGGENGTAAPYLASAKLY